MARERGKEKRNSLHKVRIFSALQAAKLCGVVNQTAINWIKNGHLKAFKTPGGQYRVFAKDLEAFLVERGMDESLAALRNLLKEDNRNILLIATADDALNYRLKDELNKILPDFSLIQAFDVFEMGIRLLGEKPHFILLDSELLGVNPGRSLRTLKREPVFGNPFVFVIADSSESRDSVKKGGGLQAEGFAEYGNTVDRVLSKPPIVEDLVETIKDLANQTKTSA